MRQGPKVIVLSERKHNTPVFRVSRHEFLLLFRQCPTTENGLQVDPFALNDVEVVQRGVQYVDYLLDLYDLVHELAPEF